MKFTRQTIEYAPPVGSSAGLLQPAKIGALLTTHRSTINRIAFAFLCVTLFALCASPVWADQCSPALPVGTATGCGAVITVTSVDNTGTANGFNVAITGNGNPYDGVEDTLIGVQNNSGATLNFMPLSSTSPIFGFDHDGPCSINPADCFNGATSGVDPGDYQGPNNTFSITDVNHGTVNFIGFEESGGMPPGQGTFFALEGTPNSLALAEIQTVHFPQGVTTQTANFGNGGSANSFALTSTNVTNPNGIDVTITAHYVDTEFSNGGLTGPNIVDGVCENLPPSPVPVDDLDCLLAGGGFVFATLGNGDKVVPHAPPVHNGQAVWYSTSTTAVAGTDYTSGNWYDLFTWVTNPSLAMSPVNGAYPPGWNNLNQRLYDHPESDTTDNFFLKDITDFFDFDCCSGGGHQLNLNHWMWGAVPNGFTDTEETITPIPRISPFPYIKGLPMLVSLELEKLNTETPDPNALSKPNTLTVSTCVFGSATHPCGTAVAVQFPKGSPTTFTYSPFLKVYYIFLSSTPYSKGVVYNMQLSSDLFSPVNLQFVVK